MFIDERYMLRALQLARLGAGHTSPNPMVGAVIVGPDGCIIGEGWHRKCGEAHAEVNAEGGTQVLRQMIDAGTWDEARIETSPRRVGQGVVAPHIAGRHATRYLIDGNTISTLVPEI